MEPRPGTRREFIRNASVAAVLPLFLNCGASAQKAESDLLAALKRNAITDPNCSWCGAMGVPANTGSRTVLAGERDAGERIVIAGNVYGRDGKTPLPNALIYLYHTDVHGIYGRGGEHRHGRYRGWMLTDEKGRYEFETILPASYPDSTIAKHIHMTVTTADRKEDWIDSILFEGDRFITSSERIVRKGGFNPILRLEKTSDGKQRGTRDVLIA